MDQWQLETPVAFLFFNRPDMTAKVLQEIRKVEPPKLLLIADGPREDQPGEAKKCAAARGCRTGRLELRDSKRLCGRKSRYEKTREVRV